MNQILNDFIIKMKEIIDVFMAVFTSLDIISEVIVIILLVFILSIFLAFFFWTGFRNGIKRRYK